MLMIVPGPNATIFASLGVRLAKYWHTFSCPLFFGTIRKKGGLLGESRARCEMAARHQGRSNTLGGGMCETQWVFFPPHTLGTTLKARESTSPAVCLASLRLNHEPQTSGPV